MQEYLLVDSLAASLLWLSWNFYFLTNRKMLIFSAGTTDAPSELTLSPSPKDQDIEFILQVLFSRSL